MSNKIEFTDSAKKEIERVVSQKASKTYFRISVQGGGCSGFKYSFSFDDKIKTSDNVSNNITNILFFGQVSHYKGIDILIQAAEKLSKKYDNFKVTIAGKCDDFNQYETQVDYEIQNQDNLEIHNQENIQMNIKEILLINHPVN